MSTFGVTVEQISKVWNHPNADRLDLAQVEGMSFQFVVGRDQYKIGDLVLYFPVDAVLPDDVIEKLGLVGKLSGAKHNRVKTVKLRGEISQGLVSPLTDWALLIWDTLESIPDKIGADVAGALGIVKYEPEEEFHARPENLLPLPELVGVYDIEGADRHPTVVEMMMDMPVIVTEKIEGSHFSVSLSKDHTFTVCQRRFSIKEDSSDHLWIRVAEEMDLKGLLEFIHLYLGSNLLVTLRGELVGPKIQGNYYDLKKHDIYFFEIEVDGQPIPAAKFYEVFEHVKEYKTVPILGNLFFHVSLREYLHGASLQEASNGPSKLVNKMREGIVIRPAYEEKWLSGLGRLILKQRSPEYLAKSES